MKDIKVGIILKGFECLSDEKCFKFLHAAKFDQAELQEIYSHVHLRRNFNYSLRYMCEKALEERFLFLGDFYLECFNSNRFDLLAIPIFPTSGVNFSDVVNQIVVTPVKGKTLKTIGESTKKFGVTFLNNLFRLKQLALMGKLEWDIQKICSQDHSRELPLDIYNNSALFGLLLENYTFERTFQLILDDHRYVNDLRLMLKKRKSIAASELKDSLPKKPKTLKEIHDHLSEFLLKHEKEDFDLNQIIAPIDCLPLKEYTIEVPKRALDLVQTSIDLKHCVHSYSEKVKNGQCQILNLTKDKKRVYTIELKRTEGRWVITQFKGYRNNREMEYEMGKPYKEGLIRLMENL